VGADGGFGENVAAHLRHRNGNVARRRSAAAWLGVRGDDGIAACAWRGA